MTPASESLAPRRAYSLPTRHGLQRTGRPYTDCHRDRANEQATLVRAQAERPRKLRGYGVGRGRVLADELRF